MHSQTVQNIFISSELPCYSKWHVVFTWNYSNCFQGAENTESPQSGYIPQVHKLCDIPVDEVKRLTMLIILKPQNYITDMVYIQLMNNLLIGLNITTYYIIKKTKKYNL